MNITLYHRSPWMTISLAEASAGGTGGSSGSSGSGGKGYRADILINGPIGQWDYSADSYKEGRRLLKEEIRKELAALAGLSAREIVVEITSLGGNVQHALAIHDYLAQFPGTVITRVIGMTASSATVVAQAGNRREISANALYLIHRAGPPYGYAQGANAVELRAAADGYEVLDKRMLAIYAKRSGKTETDIWAVMNEDNGNGRWMDADRAKALGLVDEVFEPMPATAAAAHPDQADAAAQAQAMAEAVAAAHLPPLPERSTSVPAAAAGASHSRVPDRHSEQTRQQVDGAASVAAGAQSTPPGDNAVKITADQVKTLTARFGAEAALAAVTDDLDYAQALDRASEAQAKALVDTRQQLGDVTAERDTLKGENDTLKKQVADGKAGLQDPLKPSDPKNPPAAPDAEAKAKTEAEAKADAEKMAELVAAANSVG